MSASSWSPSRGIGRAAGSRRFIPPTQDTEAWFVSRYAEKPPEVDSGLERLAGEISLYAGSHRGQRVHIVTLTKAILNLTEPMRPSAQELARVRLALARAQGFVSVSIEDDHVRFV